MPTPPKDRSDDDQFLEVDHLDSDLRGRSVRGGAVTIVNQGAKFFIALGATAVLARLLEPADFGLIAMVMAIIGFIGIFRDLGLSMATIQRPNISQAQVSTLFWINVGVSLLAMVIIATLAPVLAWYYKEPRVVRITFVLAGTIIFSGLIVQHMALLRRQMRFTVLAMIEIVTMVVGFATGIVCAWMGLGYWSLVLIPVIREFGMMTGVWAFCRWRPGRPSRRSGVGALVSFGADLTGFNVVNYFARNLDKILIGRYWGATPLGLYNKAYQLLLLPIQQINNPITSVAVPTLSRLQKQTDRYINYYRRGVFLTVSIGMPVVAFLFVAADTAVLTLLGDQWLESVPIFRALGPAAFMGTLNMATGWVYLSLGTTKRMLRWGVFSSVIIALAFLVGVRWGPIGVALTYSTMLVVLPPFAMMYCYRASPLTMKDLGVAIWRPALSSITAGAALFGVGAFFEPAIPVGFRLVLDFFIYLVFYIILWVGLPRGRQSLRDIRRIAGELSPGKLPPTDEN